MSIHSESDARFFAAWQVADFAGPVIAIDVLRVFTTPAYAFASGASAICLLASVARVDFKAKHPGPSAAWPAIRNAHSPRAGAATRRS